MANNTNVLLNWLKTFQTNWLPENIPNNIPLLESIKTKLHEFEQIIIENTENDEEYHRAKLLNDHSSSNSDNEQIAIASTSAYDTPIELHIPHQSDNENDEDRAREILLEQSDNSSNHDDDDDIILLRPSIRLKRISEADAEKYKPLAWRNENEHNKTSSTTSSTSDDDEDNDSYNIKYRTRRASINKTEKSSNKFHKQTKNSRKKTNDVIINYNPSKLLNEPSLNNDDNSISIPEDINSIPDNQLLENIIENNDDELIFESLNTTEKETNSNNQIQDSLNEEIIQLPNEDSLSDDDQPQNEVPSYSHLLNHSKISSSSDSDVSKKKNSSNNDKKRLLTSSPNSDERPKKKKSKGLTKKQITISSLSSSSSDENNLTLTTHNNRSSTSKESSPLTSSRIRIERSSSEDSNDKTSKKRTQKSSKSNERSNILKQIKRKTLEKKGLKSTTTTSDSTDDENENKTKKSKNDSNEEDEEISPSKGRKNIRKILDDIHLDTQTKNAIEAERERRKRIAENQKKYNDTLIESSSQNSNNAHEQNDNNSNSRLILELNKTTNEPLIEVSSKLVEKLKEHQCEGIKFLWNNVFESIDAIQNKKNSGNGCILAHCMGLGKTLQVISFIHTIFNYKHLTNVKTCLVLCPLNAALNWSNEFDYWLNNIEPPIDHYQLTTIRPNLRINHLNYWYENGGVAIMGYDLYRKLANGNGIKNKKNKADAYKCLVDPGPDIVVADEGHILKNAQTALARCLSKIKTRRRIVLTGTPLQNNLIEYYCMVSFIKPNLLGSQSEYINRFVNPIQNGQHRDSNEEDVRLMKRRACVLHEVLSGFVDRKDYSLLKRYLPPKYEYIINIRLSDLQSRLYEIYLDKLVDKQQRLSVTKNDFKSAKLFADYQYLQKIWTHPFLLYPYFINHWKKRFNKDDASSTDDSDLDIMFIDDDEENTEKKKNKSNKKDNKLPSLPNYSGFLIDNVKDEVENNQSTTSKTTKRRASNSSTTTTTLDSDCQDNNDKINGENESNSKTSGDDDDDDDIEIIRTYPTRSRTTLNNTIEEESKENDNSDEPWLDEMREQFWYPFLDMLPEECQYDIELSGKFLLLKSILDKCTEIGDKIILFSRSIYTLNHIEEFLNHLQIQNEKDHQSQLEFHQYLPTNNNDILNQSISEPIQWIRDQDYFRMDGQTDVTARKRFAKIFNDPTNIRARLFLISTLAGGIGINLIGSNRVIVFDASWNPSHDTQAIFRSYRFGQKKPVYIYRFLAHGTMEEKIYQRQVVKQSISQRVVDDHQLDRHFTQNDIKELYKFKPEQLPDAQTTSTPLDSNYPIPKDHLLLDLLYEHNRWIHSYHSHDSLLENKIDEGLTVEERRRALEEYENLKRLPDPRQIALQRMQEQQRLNTFIAQQQQRVALLTMQQSYPQLHEVLQTMHGQNYNVTQMLQHLQAIGAMPTATNTNINQRITPGPVNIQPRPTVTNTNINQRITPAASVNIQSRPTATKRSTNDVIVVESDEEPVAQDLTVPK